MPGIVPAPNLLLRRAGGAALRAANGVVKGAAAEAAEAAVAKFAQYATGSGSSEGAASEQPPPAGFSPARLHFTMASGRKAEVELPLQEVFEKARQAFRKATQAASNHDGTPSGESGETTETPTDEHGKSTQTPSDDGSESAEAPIDHKKHDPKVTDASESDPVDPRFKTARDRLDASLDDVLEHLSPEDLKKVKDAVRNTYKPEEIVKDADPSPKEDADQVLGADMKRSLDLEKKLQDLQVEAGLIRQILQIARQFAKDCIAAAHLR